QRAVALELRHPVLVGRDDAIHHAQEVGAVAADELFQQGRLSREVVVDTRLGDADGRAQILVGHGVRAGALNQVLGHVQDALSGSLFPSHPAAPHTAILSVGRLSRQELSPWGLRAAVCAAYLMWRGERLMCAAVPQETSM